MYKEHNNSQKNIVKYILFLRLLTAIALNVFYKQITRVSLDPVPKKLSTRSTYGAEPAAGRAGGTSWH